MKPPVVQVQLLIRKPVAEVFESMVDPAITSKFWFSKGSGRLEPGAKVRWDWEMYGASASVEVKAMEQNKSISVEWGGPQSPTTSVDWSFEPRGADQTLVKVANAGFEGDPDTMVARALDSMGGFTSLLAAQKAYLEHGIELNLVLDNHPEALVAGWASRQTMLIGMVHVLALPGTPRNEATIGRIVDEAVAEACILQETGFDGLILENMHDVPYVHGNHPPETVACMTRVGVAVRQAVPQLRMGIQILSGGAREAVAVAQAIGAEFVRVENFVFAHVADEGLLERAEAGPLLRYRKSIGATEVKIYADIKKKHASHAITADISLAEAAKAAEFFGADGLIVTGTATGEPTDPSDLAQVKKVTGLPVLVGSGVTPKQLSALQAEGLIVGSYIKEGGIWSGAVDRQRCLEMVQAFRASG